MRASCLISGARAHEGATVEGGGITRVKRSGRCLFGRVSLCVASAIALMVPEVIFPYFTPFEARPPLTNSRASTQMKRATKFHSASATPARLCFAFGLPRVLFLLLLLLLLLPPLPRGVPHSANPQFTLINSGGRVRHGTPRTCRGPLRMDRINAARMRVKTITARTTRVFLTRSQSLL